MESDVMSELMGTVFGAAQRWKHLTIADPFIFNRVMRNKALCCEILEVVLLITIDHIDYFDEDGSHVIHVYSRDGAVYEIEIQAIDIRSSFAMQTQRSAPIAIYICNSDPFEQGRRIYSFHSRCDENQSLMLRDGKNTLILAASSPVDSRIDARLNEFLDYVANGTVVDELSLRLDAEVHRVLGNESCRLEYIMRAVESCLGVDRRSSSWGKAAVA